MLGELANGEALLAQFERLFEVEVPSRATERFALPSRALQASARSSDQLLSLLLRDPSKDRDQQLTHRALGIEPRLAKAHDTHAKLIKRENSLHVARHRAAKPVKRPDEQHAEGTTMCVVQEPSQLRASFRCAHLFFVDTHESPAASGRELFEFRPLVVNRLVCRGSAEVDCGSHHVTFCVLGEKLRSGTEAQGGFE